MTTEISTPTGNALAAAARAAGIDPQALEAGADFHGRPTARLTFSGSGAALALEVTEGFEATTAEQTSGLTQYFRDIAARLQTPEPELYVTTSGLPLRFSGFKWPFHRSTSGADTYIVHGTVQLADGHDSALHAKISASMTVTFAEVVPAPEQPYAEDFIYNAVRKTFDYGQLELLKSGNRQPVPVTMRYYSRWQNKFVFTDSSDEVRLAFLARKAFWLSAVHGNGAPVWLADPRDAQYLNTSVEQLKKDAYALAQDGVIALAADQGYGAASAALKAREAEYRLELDEALASIKPTFNEEMRGGHTNM
jgi:hypothetical protein